MGARRSTVWIVDELLPGRHAAQQVVARDLCANRTPAAARGAAAGGRERARRREHSQPAAAALLPSARHGGVGGWPPSEIHHSQAPPPGSAGLGWALVRAGRGGRGGGNAGRVASAGLWIKYAGRRAGRRGCRHEGPACTVPPGAPSRPPWATLCHQQIDFVKTPGKGPRSGTLIHS